MTLEFVLFILLLSLALGAFWQIVSFAVVRLVVVSFSIDASTHTKQLLTLLSILISGSCVIVAAAEITTFGPHQLFPSMTVLAGLTLCLIRLDTVQDLA